MGWRVPAPGGGGGGCLLRRVPALEGGCLLQGGLVRGVPGGDPPPTATAAGGTHPTGMHSCLHCEKVKANMISMIPSVSDVAFAFAIM